MTFRCALRFEPDKAKGPGYGLILASCPGFSAAPNTLLYMIKDPSNGMSLGPNGWQPATPSRARRRRPLGRNPEPVGRPRRCGQPRIAGHLSGGAVHGRRACMAGRPQHQPDRLFARSEPPARSGACPKSRAFRRARAPAHAGNGNRPSANVALLRWETRLGGPGQRTAKSEGTPKKLQKPYPEHHLCYPYGNSACRGRILHLYAGPAQNGHDAGGKARRSPEA